MCRSGDPIADWNHHCDKEEAARDKLPRCDECGEIIEDECYEINGILYCESCIMSFKTKVEYLVNV